MRIKITADLPVASEVRPEIGSVHEVTGSKDVSGGQIYFIKMGDAQIGVLSEECETVEGSENG